MEERYPGYEAAHEKKTGPTYITRTKLAFFLKFKTPQAEREGKRKVRGSTYIVAHSLTFFLQQIESFLRNHKAAAKLKISPTVNAANAAVTDLILGSFTTPRPKKDLQPVQAFSKLYLPLYRDAIQAAWDEARQVNALTTKSYPSVGFRNGFLQTQLDSKPPEIHKEVQDFIVQEREAAIARYEQQMQDEGLLTAEEMKLDPNEQDSIIEARTRLRYDSLFVYLR